jgi:polysaccharide export outer membrane protein
MQFSPCATVLLLFSLLATPAASAQSARLDTTAVLAPGDLVRIAVWTRPDLSGEFVVAPDGSIAHPLYRAVKVAGIPLPMIEERIRTFLAGMESNPTLFVYPLLRIFVGGEVRSPNVYTVPPGTTVAQAVSLAGGPTGSGKMEKVQVTREPGSFTVDLTKPDPAIARTEIRSGDRIMVGRRRAFLQDVVAPAASITAATAALIGIVLQLRK